MATCSRLTLIFLTYFGGDLTSTLRVIGRKALIDFSYAAIEGAPHARWVILGFLVLLHALNLLTSQKRHDSLKRVYFSLYYRGLSLNGFHFLNEMGLCPTPRTISLSNKALVLAFHAVACTFGMMSVVWFDNVQRKAIGHLTELQMVNATVVGETLVPLDLTSIEMGAPALAPQLTAELRDSAIEDVGASANTDLEVLFESLDTLDSLSVPLRSKDSEHFQFREKDVYPIVCGTMIGTVQVLKKLQEDGLFAHSEVVLLSVDYDLYWRLMKLLYTSSLHGAFSTLRQKTLLMQAPWHLYKTMCEAVWTVYGPLLLWEMHFASSSRERISAPKRSSIPRITFLLIAVHFWTRTHSFPNTPIGELLNQLCEELIPLVLSVGMSIQENAFRKFFKLMPKVLSWLASLGRTNYLNAWTVSYMQYKYWDQLEDQTAIEVLERCFKAFSEERGEISIHHMTELIRDWHVTVESLQRRYRETATSYDNFRELGVSRSHKANGTRFYRADEERIRRVTDTLQHILDNFPTWIPYSRGDHKVFNDSPRLLDQYHWDEVMDRNNHKEDIASDRMYQVLTLMTSTLAFFDDENTADLIPDSLLFW